MRKEAMKVHGRGYTPRGYTPRSSADSIQQDLMQGSAALALRTPSGAAGCPPGTVRDWSISDVLQFMHFLGLSHVAGKFEENAVSGEDLLKLSEEDFIQELGLTKLQTSKIIRAIKKIVPPAPSTIDSSVESNPTGPV